MCIYNKGIAKGSISHFICTSSVFSIYLYLQNTSCFPIRKEIKDKTVLYFSVFEWPADQKLVIPELKNKVVSALLLVNGTKLKTIASKENTTILLPTKAPDTVATVIKVTVRGKIDVKPDLEIKK